MGIGSDKGGWLFRNALELSAAFTFPSSLNCLDMRGGTKNEWDSSEIDRRRIAHRDEYFHASGMQKSTKERGILGI